jgi:hypothetical protein
MPWFHSSSSLCISSCRGSLVSSSEELMVVTVKARFGNDHLQHSHNLIRQRRFQLCHIRDLSVASTSY